MKPTSDNHHLWRFVTNHAHVLEVISTDPASRLRDIAAAVGITERTAAQIVNDLELAGYLTRTRVGRRNRYVIEGDRKIATPRLPRMTVGQVLALLLKALDQPLP
jgi:hypothetical protein